MEEKGKMGKVDNVAFHDWFEDSESLLFFGVVFFPDPNMFNRKPMVKKKQGMMEAVDDPDLSFSKIMKDVQLFASSHMTWKDKKALENQKVTGLGGKPQRKQRLPLSVARVQMKKQKEREEKTFEQNVIFGQFGGTSRKKPAADKKRKPEERVLKSTFGNFRGGVLDVKDLLRSGGSSSRTNDRDNNYGKNKNKSKGMGGELGGGGRDIKKNRKKKAKKGGGKRKSK
ncbi:unnamed protein product [Brassica napus]|uniref:(rape) hypothetical protein n=1 Tax=Brassica napus TaxID=3708 RepID=A0A816TC32_BRANA|nr:unnamed protein product [Brassica napus]